MSSRSLVGKRAGLRIGALTVRTLHDKYKILRWLNTAATFGLNGRITVAKDIFLLAYPQINAVLGFHFTKRSFGILIDSGRPEEFRQFCIETKRRVKAVTANDPHVRGLHRRKKKPK